MQAVALLCCGCQPEGAMSKVKTPHKKKRLAYDRDHVSPAEYPHAFRKNWPRKKATAERRARRKARQVLAATGDDTEVATIRRKQIWKWGVLTVRESLEFKRRKRQALIGTNKARRARQGEDLGDG